ncbi:MAG TPA: glycosyltransferase [Ilumatobacteraceae bacterium]|nr:glycosyltransferase [Ilumatobacteraceae bacterium]HRB03332.1 glycosyltransferase [Ilumatobacteraceae bacterium]
MRRIHQLRHAVSVAPARARNAIATGRSLRSAERLTGPLDTTLLALSDRLAALDQEVSDLRATEGANHHQVTLGVESVRAEVAARAAQLNSAVELARARDLATQQALIAALWLTNAPIASAPLVSVVMPTYLPSRLGHLRHAIDSVLAQSYDNWELLVVDNSRDDMLDELPDWWPHDPRVHVLRSTPHRGNQARNEALAVARGALIAYLDDDCVWFPWWLRAAVTSLEGAPAAQFAYGILLLGSAGLAPEWINAIPLTPLQLHLDNPVDTNALVHRSQPELHWDPSLDSCGDWELVQRLAVDPHVFVPVPACSYGTNSPDRVWAPGAQNRPEVSAGVEEVRSRARRRRPLRIVAANTLYPLITETYIGDELEGLRRCGVELVLARQQPGFTECASTVDAPLFESLEEAISSIDPDLVLTHWATTAQWSGPIATARGIPHAVRLHSFCAAVPDDVIYNEWCVGTWGFAHAPRNHPLSRELPTMILDPGLPNTDDTSRQRTLLSVSAGLPKKAWHDLVTAAVEISDARLHIIMGRTNGWDHLAGEVRTLAEQHGRLDAVDIDVPFAVAQRAIRSSTVLVYTSAPGVHLGQPRSIIEAALAATPLVVPDEPAIRAMVGETATFYTRGNTASLVAALRGALDHPHPIDQRLALAARIRAVHAAPGRFDQWAHELTRAVVDWQSSRIPGAATAAGRWWSQR